MIIFVSIVEIFYGLRPLPPAPLVTGPLNYKRRCMKCEKEKGFGAFSSAIWCLPPGSKDFLCKFCTQSGRKIGHWTCFAADCKKVLPSSDFVLAREKYTEQDLRRAKNRVCDVCMLARQKLQDDIAASNTSQVLKYRRIS